MQYNCMGKKTTANIVAAATDTMTPAVVYNQPKARLPTSSHVKSVRRSMALLFARARALSLPAKQH